MFRRSYIIIALIRQRDRTNFLRFYEVTTVAADISLAYDRAYDKYRGLPTLFLSYLISVIIIITVHPVRKMRKFLRNPRKIEKFEKNREILRNLRKIEKFLRKIEKSEKKF